MNINKQISQNQVPNEENKNVNAKKKALVPKPVEFYNSTIFVVAYQGEPFVPMKPIVVGMGLDWDTQKRKINNSLRWGHMTLPCETPGGVQDMLCIHLKKLNGWMYSVNPEKVKPEIRDSIIMYQEESTHALYEYWNNGCAENPRMKEKRDYFDQQTREYKALISLGRMQGLNDKDQAAFASEKMIQRYGNVDGIFGISPNSISPDHYPEDVQVFFEMLDKLLETGEIVDHDDRLERVWISMPQAFEVIERHIGRSFNRGIMYQLVKKTERYIEKKDNKKSKVLKKQIRAWSFTR